MNLPIYEQAWPYFTLAAGLLAIGIFGLLRRHTLVGMLISGELIFSAAQLNVMAMNRFAAVNPVPGQVFVLIIMGLAAAEVAIGLSIIIAIYRHYGSIRTRKISDLNS